MVERTLAIMVKEGELSKLDSRARIYIKQPQHLPLHGVTLRELNTGKVLVPSEELLPIGILVESSSALNLITAEYVALELTNRCNMACMDWCFNLQDRKGRGFYMAQETAEIIAQSMGISQRPKGRQLCLTGGEPTLDLEALATITHTFSRYQGNRIVIATNGTNFPLAEEDLAKFFDIFPEGTGWQISYDEKHARYFPKHLKQAIRDTSLPYHDDPLLALVVYVTEYLRKRYGRTEDPILDIRVTVHPCQIGKNFHFKTLLDALGTTEREVAYGKGIAHPYLSMMAYDARGNGLLPSGYSGAARLQEICSTGEEAYIDCQGKIWPTYHWKCAKKNCVGQLVWLEK